MDRLPIDPRVHAPTAPHEQGAVEGADDAVAMGLRHLDRIDRHIVAGCRRLERLVQLRRSASPALQGCLERMILAMQETVRCFEAHREQILYRLDRNAPVAERKAHGQGICPPGWTRTSRASGAAPPAPEAAVEPTGHAGDPALGGS